MLKTLLQYWPQDSTLGEYKTSYAGIRKEAIRLVPLINQTTTSGMLFWGCKAKKEENETVSPWNQGTFLSNMAYCNSHNTSMSGDSDILKNWEQLKIELRNEFPMLNLL